MSCDSNKPIVLYRGTTYSEVFRWGIAPFVYKTASAAPALTPLTLTVTGHGAPNGWSVALTDFSTFTDLNASDWPPAPSDYFQATVTDANTLVFNEVDAARLGSFTAAGLVAYMTPVDLTGASASFKVYPFPATTTTPTALFTVAATLDNTAKTITVALSAANTALLVGQQYSYTLVATDASSNVTLLDQGFITPKTLGLGT